jgi:hypothetical protein
MAINYQTASLEEVAQHYKTASRQAVYEARKQYRDNPDVLMKLERAFIMAKIARLQDELEALDRDFEVTKNG